MTYDGHGGKRSGAGMAGRKNPNAGRKPISQAGTRIAVNVTLDPDIHAYVTTYAQRNGVNFSQGINQLLLLLDADRTGQCAEKEKLCT